MLSIDAGGAVNSQHHVYKRTWDTARYIHAYTVDTQG